MEFTDWLIVKLVIVAVAAFVYKFWEAFTGRSDR